MIASHLGRARCRAWTLVPLCVALSSSLSFARQNYLILIADDLGCSMAQLAIAWCLKNPNVSTVILGATSETQLAENLGASEQVAKLDDAVMERIEAIVANKPEMPQQF